MYYFLVGVSQGRPWRSGPHLSREEALEIGIQNCGSNFEVFESETRDFNKARQETRFKQVQSGVPVVDTLRRHRINRVRHDEAG